MINLPPTFRVAGSSSTPLSRMSPTELERVDEAVAEMRRRWVERNPDFWDRYDPIYYVRGDQPEFDFSERDPAALLSAYAKVESLRGDRLSRLRSDPRLVGHLKAYYADHPADFISDWGSTFDPRNPDIGLPATVPFLLFRRQREWIDYVLERWRLRERGLTEKSRDSGISWLAISLSCTLCLFGSGLVIGFGSRVEEYVDKLGEPKSLFEKARMFLRDLPSEFTDGWDPRKHAFHMRITFPGTGSFLTGEGGANIGRGNRTTLYFVDEAQPLDAKVMTPGGWMQMIDMRPGIQVTGADGQPQTVTHVNDCGVHDVFRVCLSDGTSAEVSPNHLWAVENVIGKRQKRTLRTYEIAEQFRYESPGGQIQYRFRLPVCLPVEFDRTDALPMNPYLLGALLGDGSFSSGTIRITTADSEVLESFRCLLPIGVVIGAFDGRYSYNIVDGRGRLGRARDGGYPRSRARALIERLGLKGIGSPDKFIPDIYKFARPAERLALLQGLLDTDGYAAKSGAASFHTTSPRLADDLKFLVQSLGGIAIHSVSADARGYRDRHRLQIALPSGMLPFRLKRKLDRLKRRKHPLHRTIVSVEHVGRKPVRCITVGSSDGLYLTDNFIVTHNSAHLEHPLLAEASLSNTTNCRQDISTPRGLGNPFEQNRHGGRIKVFTFHWKDDPRKDDAWYAKQIAEAHSPAIVAQEVDIDYAASVEGVLIPHAWVMASFDAHEKLGFEATGRRSGAFDVADEGQDLLAFAVGHGAVVEWLEEWAGKGSDISESVERAARICDHFELDGYRYDADGLGAGVRGVARTINEQRALLGLVRRAAAPFRGSGSPFAPEAQDVRGRKNKDLFANAKAQAWWALRERFRKTHRAVVPDDEGKTTSVLPDEAISLSRSIDEGQPNMRLKLAAELSQPTFSVNGVGKIVIDKAPEGARSPNLADALMILFSRGSFELRVSDEVIGRSRIARTAVSSGPRSASGSGLHVSQALLQRSRDPGAFGRKY